MCVRCSVSAAPCSMRSGGRALCGDRAQRGDRGCGKIPLRGLPEGLLGSSRTLREVTVAFDDRTPGRMTDGAAHVTVPVTFMRVMRFIFFASPHRLQPFARMAACRSGLEQCIPVWREDNSAAGFWHGRNRRDRIAMPSRAILRGIVFFSDGAPDTFASLFRPTKSRLLPVAWKAAMSLRTLLQRQSSGRPWIGIAVQSGTVSAGHATHSETTASRRGVVSHRRATGSLRLRPSALF